MNTYIVFVDRLAYSGRWSYRVRTTRKEVKAPDILTASAQATQNGGTVSMIWIKWS